MKTTHHALCRRRLDRPVPDLQHPDNPVPLLKDQIDRLHIGGG
jgi:hypothetical protein